jgi:putative two-component system response regulator
MGFSVKVLARALGWTEAAADLLRKVAPLHDVGKIGIPDAILFKPGSLTPEEWRVMRTHPLLGERILSGSSAPLHRLAAEVAAHHHERWDGSGYPRGLKGEAIPMSARIVALVDQYDALRCRRPYKPPIDHATACGILLNGDSRILPTHFQPELLRAFLRVSGLIAAIYCGTSCWSLA